MKDLVCTPKQLPIEKMIAAAKTATTINPLNHAPVESLVRLMSDFAPTLERKAAVTTKYWGPQGVKLKVGFMDNPGRDLKKRLLLHMNAWAKTANVMFVESATDPQVRIARDDGRDGGYWSYLGTDILHIAKNKQTMNLESFTMNTPESEMRRVVRHETGHTLGFPHEHLPRALVAILDVAKTIAYFESTQGWSEAEIRAQVLTPFEESTLRGTSVDATSIMSYQLPGSITRNGNPILGGLDIDAKDYSFAALIYPKPNEPRKEKNSTTVRVFYATDRDHHIKKSVLSYSKRRAPAGRLDFGQCEVSIPEKHKFGKLEAPSFLKFEFRPDPKKHIALIRIENLGERTFFDKVAQSVSKSKSKDTFIFVHGYNVSFEAAARRTAQIAWDLKFIGAPIFYSWPSQNVTKDYTIDEAQIIWTVPHLERFLEQLALRSGAKRIHIIAHSMGNRAVCDALRALSRPPKLKFQFNHLVLAAPDIDADTFRELADMLKRISRGITLYESSNDKAIKASRAVHGLKRAGEPLLIIPGLDTIDASSVDTDFFGHSYFSSTLPLLTDINSILIDDKPADERVLLETKEHSDGTYYTFKRIQS
jgi:esterase/lipase superfamily enzyme